MHTEIYIEALLVDAEAADAGWEDWDKGVINTQVAWLTWCVLTIHADSVRYAKRKAE